jgi:hypothetical protein
MAMGLMPTVSAQAIAATTRQNEALDVAVTYTSSYAGLTTGDNNFWFEGGSAEVTATFWHGLGGTANVTGLHIANSGQGIPVNVVTTTFGPRYMWVRNRGSGHDLRFFGEGLVGIANGFSGYYPTAQGETDSANGLAMQVGGGADYGLSKRFAVRLLQTSWLRTRLPNATTNIQNNLTLGAGVVFSVR